MLPHEYRLRIFMREHVFDEREDRGMKRSIMPLDAPGTIVPGTLVQRYCEHLTSARTGA